MNIIILNQSYYPNNGGIENSLYYIARNLKDQGNSVTICTASYNKEQKEEELVEGVQIIRYPFYKIAKRKFLPVKPILHIFIAKNFLKRKYISGNDIDLIISRDFHLTIASKLAFKDIKDIYIPPLLVKEYRKVLLKKLSKSALKWNVFLKVCLTRVLLYQESYLQNTAFRVANKIVCFSENLKKQVEDENNNLNKNINVLPPGVDKEKFRDSKEYKDINSELVKEKLPYLLYVGRIVKEKNLDILIEAVKISNQNFKLLLVGTGPYKKELEKKIKELKLGKNVILLGESSNTNAYYNLAKFTILPSTYEAFGQVIVESFSCGTPCLAFKSNYPDVKVASSEIIEESKTGLLAESVSPKDLAKKIDQAFLISEKEYNQMEKSCILEAKKYDWKVFSEKLLTL